MAQFRKDTQQFLPQEKTIFEVNMLSTPDGQVVSNTNPLPVTLGNSTIQITSNNVNVTVPNTISVNSSANNPVHVHITDIGGYDITTPYMPIAGNVNVAGYLTSTIVSNVANPVVITGTVNVGNFQSSTNTNIHHSSGNNITKTEPLPVYISSVPNLDNAPWNIQVARGLVPGVSQVNIFAFNSAITTTWNPVWENSTAYTFPASALTLTCNSTSSSDDTRCNVAITGLDSNWVAQTEIVPLNGTNPVTTTKQFLRINGMSLTRPGTGQVTNIGTITARNNGTIYGQINPNVSKMQNSWYSVPAANTLYVSRVTAFSGDSSGASKYMQTRVDVHNNVTDVNFILVQLTWSNYYEVPRDNIQPYTEKSDVRWEANTSQGVYSCAFVVQGLLIAN